jgi:hypothetical protein
VAEFTRGAKMKKVRIKNPDAKLITIRTLNDPVEAELVKNTLTDHGIRCRILDDHQGGFTGIFSIGIVVGEADADRADEILDIHHPHRF